MLSLLLLSLHHRVRLRERRCSNNSESVVHWTNREREREWEREKEREREREKEREMERERERERESCSCDRVRM